jgi:threonine/homoserine/homoserine lactone efflux protein
MGELLAFLGVAALVIMTPGPDTAVMIRSTLVGGRRAGVMTAFGVVTGQACWTVAASAGITALLIASEPAFLAVRYAGAAYLLYLGLGSLAAAIRGAEPVERARVPAVPRTTAYRQGVLSDLSNATMAAFGLLFCALTWVWLALYATALARLRHVLRRAAVRRAIEAVTGTVLVALGLRVATEPSR